MQVLTKFKALQAGDKSTIKKYSHLLSKLDYELPSSIPQLAFHQMVMTDLADNANEEELDTINNFIRSQLKRDRATHERL